METNRDRLVLKVFGGYTLTYDGRPITLGRGNLTKAVQLLQILLLNMKNGIAKDELIRDLYDWEDGTDTNNSLNSMIWRLKNQLVSAGMPKEDYISIKNGVCKWCGSMPVEVDAVLFEEYYEKAKNAEGESKREYLECAVELYRGEFLPRLSNELWAAAENVRLKKMYMQCVRQISTILEENQEYQQLFHIYKTAAEIYPFEGWQEKQIDVLQKMERYDEAFHLYQDTVHLYYEELGTPPSMKMRELLQKMNGKLLNSENDFLKIHEMLCEDEWKSGAYYCPYPSFRDTYRLMCRVIDRSGVSIYLMACNLYYENPSLGTDPEAEKNLGLAIGKSLRRGDVYTRYSGSQYLILLFAAQKENCDMIFRRIEKSFDALMDNQKCWIEYELTEAVNLPQESSEGIHFKHKTTPW